RRSATRPRGEVALFHERDPQAPQGRVACDSGSDDATPDNQEVPFLPGKGFDNRRRERRTCGRIGRDRHRPPSTQAPPKEMGRNPAQKNRQAVASPISARRLLRLSTGASIKVARGACQPEPEAE